MTDDGELRQRTDRMVWVIFGLSALMALAVMLVASTEMQINTLLEYVLLAAICTLAWVLGALAHAMVIDAWSFIKLRVGVLVA